MPQPYDPIERSVSKVIPATNPKTLQMLCRNTILSAVTLERYDKIEELLPLPTPLKRTISILNFQDFFIDAENLAAGNHEKQSYPAKCLLGGNQCVIKVRTKGSKPDVQDPSFISSFEYKDNVFCVYEKTDTVQDLIARCKVQNTRFQDAFIWKIIKGVLQFILKNETNTSTKINSSLVHQGSNGNIFLEEDNSQMSQMQMGATSAIYEAPEVLRREPETKQSFSWTIGCIIYEMLALEPAFYDRTGSNPFQVFMDMMQGVLPPEPPEGGAELKSVMWNCFKLNPDERIPPEEILKVATSQSK